jgi:hypothetical protein
MVNRWQQQVVRDHTSTNDREIDGSIHGQMVAVGQPHLAVESGSQVEAPDREDFCSVFIVSK